MSLPTSLYRPGTTWLHRLHPLTRLTFSLCALLIIFGAPGGWWAAALPGLLALLLLWRAGLARPALSAGLRILAPLALMLFVIHGLFNPANQTVLLQVGVLRIGQEGLAYAALIFTRLAAALLSSLLLVLGTHPAHLIQALSEAGLPSGLAYLLGSPLLLLPQMAGRIRSIQAAQQARGLETQGSLLQRARALFPLVAPLIFSALLDVEERALALDVRGFSAPLRKTSLTQLHDTPAQRAGRWGMLLLAGLLAVARLVWRSHGSD